MDQTQKNHLKAYGTAFWTLNNGINVEWILNYRGGSFMVDSYPEVEKECRIRGVSYDIIGAEQTLIIFSRDNGPHQEGGADPHFFNSSGGLRGFKLDLYEGGIRVPMIARWTGAISAGTVSEHVSAFWDVTCSLTAPALTAPVHLER